VFLEDTAKIALAGMLTDLLDRKTSSKYTPVNRIIHKLMDDSNNQTVNESGKKQGKDQDAKQEE